MNHYQNLTDEQLRERLTSLNLRLKENDFPKQKTEVYSRIVGYYRNVQNWNRGKKEELQERKMFVGYTGCSSCK